MEKVNVIKNIINLPQEFCKGSVSIFSLLQESGYFDLYEQITEKDIKEELTQHLECIKEWLLYSEDKRNTSGWYFVQNNIEKYIVGYFSLEENEITYEYLDKVEACAVFIKKEIETIRKC